MATEYGLRLQAAIKYAKTSQKKLGERVGIKQGTISELISKGSGSAFTAQMAAACGVDPNWLATGEGSMTAPVSAPALTHLSAPMDGPDRLSYQNLIQRGDNVRAAPPIRGGVPLLNKVNAGMFKEIIDNDGDVTTIATGAPVKRYTFALQVDGPSMEPEFPEGTVLIVEPDLEPMPNDYVIAVNGDHEATFKKLVKDGSDWYLMPLNPQFHTKPLGDAKIIGVVVSTQRMLRSN